jgi:hypothetical protein|tara:strand:+ start:184 stop:486 length:303 start_codon:yes stop_codon:yes gene_type:complete
MAKKKIDQTFEYQENEIEKAIKWIESSDVPEGFRPLILNCLKTCLSINSLLSKNRSLRRLIGRLFGFKSEKSKKKTLKRIPTPATKVQEEKDTAGEDTKT